MDFSKAGSEMEKSAALDEVFKVFDNLNAKGKQAMTILQNPSAYIEEKVKTKYAQKDEQVVAPHIEDKDNPDDKKLLTAKEFFDIVTNEERDADGATTYEKRDVITVLSAVFSRTMAETLEGKHAKADGTGIYIDQAVQVAAPREKGAANVPKFNISPLPPPPPHPLL